MKKIVKWFMELTKDSSTETKKWETLVFRTNVLLSWVGCLVTIIAVCGICFTSCSTTTNEVEINHQLESLEDGQTITIANHSVLKEIKKQISYNSHNLWTEKDKFHLGYKEFNYLGHKRDSLQNIVEFYIDENTHQTHYKFQLGKGNSRFKTMIITRY